MSFRVIEGHEAAVTPNNLEIVFGKWDVLKKLTTWLKKRQKIFLVKVGQPKRSIWIHKEEDRLHTTGRGRGVSLLMDGFIIQLFMTEGCPMCGALVHHNATPLFHHNVDNATCSILDHKDGFMYIPSSPYL